MLLVLSVTCALWGLVSCECSEETTHDPNLPYASQERNYTRLIRQFQGKHVNKTFTDWPELHAASKDDLEKACSKYAPVPSKVVGTAEYAQDIYLRNYRKDHFLLDMLTCDIKMLDEHGKEFAAFTYYFCEGDEPNTAFRFTCIFAWEKSVNLLEKAPNFWTGTSSSGGQLCTHTVGIITADGRHFVGTLRGFDQTLNLILDDSHERVYSTTQGVQQVVLGLHIIRGDNVVIVGEVDEAIDSRIDLSKIRAEPLPSIVH